MVQAEWRGSPNFWKGRDGQKVVAIVDHIMAGTLGGTDSWFRNPASEVSAHYGIGRDGRVWQWVATGDTAWANGLLNKPDTGISWLAACVAHSTNPNRVTISIEHEGQTGDSFTEAQYQATLALHRYLVAAFAIPVDDQHIIGHCRIDSINRAQCPGKGFPWARLFADLRGSGCGHHVAPNALAVITAAGRQAIADTTTLCNGDEVTLSQSAGGVWVTVATGGTLRSAGPLK